MLVDGYAIAGYIQGGVLTQFDFVVPVRSAIHSASVCARRREDRVGCSCGTVSGLCFYLQDLVLWMIALSYEVFACQ